MTNDLPRRGPGRPREFDMDLALDQAVRLFAERGFHAASIGELAEAMGVTVGSIYKAFEDKRAIFVAALDRQSSQRNGELQRHLRAGANGRDKVRLTLEFYADISCGVSGRQGCLVVGTAVELANFDPEIAGRVVDALTRREQLLADLLREGQGDGSVAAGVDVAATARCLLCLLQGLRVVGKTSPTLADMRAAVGVALKLLD